MVPGRPVSLCHACTSRCMHSQDKRLSSKDLRISTRDSRQSSSDGVLCLLQQVLFNVAGGNRSYITLSAAVATRKPEKWKSTYFPLCSGLAPGFQRCGQRGRSVENPSRLQILACVKSQTAVTVKPRDSLPGAVTRLTELPLFPLPRISRHQS